jgi:hypothetical protein
MHKYTIDEIDFDIENMINNNLPFFLFVSSANSSQ